MKQFRSLLWAVLALGLSACQAVLEEDSFPGSQVYPGETILKATIETDASTRTSFSSDGNGITRVFWNENDQIGVFVDDATDASAFRLVDGAGTRNGVFSGYGQGSRYVAAYPYGQIISLDGNTLTLDLPCGLTVRGKNSFTVEGAPVSYEIIK